MNARIDRSGFRWHVMCWKSNSTAVLWEKFETKEEALAIIDRLAAVGCSAHLRDGDAAPDTQ